MSDIIIRLLERAEDPDVLAELAARVDASAAACLSDEELAAAVEGYPSTATIAHVLQCDACDAALRRTEALLAVVPFAQPQRDTGPLAALPETPSVVATLRRRSDGTLEVVETSGVIRVEAALAVRRDSRQPGLVVADRAERPTVEVALAANGDDRMDVHVRWLGEHAPALRARATANSRVVADLPMSANSALLPGIRRRDLRVTLVSEEDIKASVLLTIEPAGDAAAADSSEPSP